MSDEIKTTEEKETKCFCQNKSFRKFLTIALGTFVGVYCALSLFAALHRPPIMPPPYAFQNRGCPIQMMHHRHHFDKGARPEKGDFAKKAPKEFGPRAPFEAPRPNNAD